MAAVSWTNIKRISVSFFLFLILGILGSPVSWSAEVPSVPVKNTVTLVDLGAHTCVPCIMMAPILKELEKEYADRAAIVFIDVWEHRELAEKFRVQTIPTQVFFDAKGNEITRHQGFMSKDAIVAELDKLLSR